MCWRGGEGAKGNETGEGEGEVVIGLRDHPAVNNT